MNKGRKKGNTRKRGREGEREMSINDVPTD